MYPKCLVKIKVNSKKYWETTLVFIISQDITMMRKKNITLTISAHNPSDDIPQKIQILKKTLKLRTINADLKFKSLKFSPAIYPYNGFNVCCIEGSGVPQTHRKVLWNAFLFNDNDPNGFNNFSATRSVKKN